MPTRMPTTPQTEGTAPPRERPAPRRLSDEERLTALRVPDEDRLAHLRDSDGMDDVPPRRELPPRVRRELLIFGPALLFGLVLVPLLIWFAGNRVLGPYTHGQDLHAGPLALLGDFFLGLWHGSAVFWAVALGPAALVLLLRLFVALVRALPPARRPG
jgi:hypothetical protein